MPGSDSDYVCTLDEVDLKKAKDELHEDPKERLGQVQALREWIQQQPHLHIPTETAMLVRFLRQAKFSQLRAREIIDFFFTNYSKYPEWFHNIDPMDPKIQALVASGGFITLPGRDKERRTIMFQRAGAADDLDVTFNDMIRMMVCIMHNHMTDEKTQVHGFVMVADWTNMTMRGLNKFGMDNMRKWHKAWQGNAQARMKKFYYYNVGSLFETVMAIFRPLMPKKYLDRMVIFDNLEKLYKLVPMEILPREYLPDDYTGPCAGTVAELSAKLQAELREPKLRESIKNISDPKWGVDESKRPNSKAAPVGSFRKLNID